MAHSASAKKRIRQNLKQRSLNRWRKGRIKVSVKQFDEAVAHGSKEAATEAYRVVTKALDQVASKGTIHQKTAARRKSRLARRLNQMTAS